MFINMKPITGDDELINLNQITSVSETIIYLSDGQTCSLTDKEMANFRQAIDGVILE